MKRMKKDGHMRTLKSTIILLALSTLITGASAGAPLENVADEIYNMNQLGKISATYLLLLDEEIATTQEMFEKELNQLKEPSTMTEGKIQASMASFINSELMKIKEQRATLDDLQEIEDKDVESIKLNLSNVQDIIRELNQ